MADEDDGAERTEDPTQKRLDDALERGDVAKSQEVNTWFMIAGATLILSSFSGSIGGMQMPLRNLIANSWSIHADGNSLFKLLSLGAVMMAILWPERLRLESMLHFDPTMIFGVITGLTIHLMGAV